MDAQNTSTDRFLNDNPPATVRPSLSPADSLLETALAYKKTGLEVVPDHPTQKFPVGFPAWQTIDFTEDVLTDCIINRGYGVGIRNCEGLDFDNHGGEAVNTLREWKALVESTNAGLVGRLLVEKTQHGGFHVVWKCSVIEKSQKLASRPPTVEELAEKPDTKLVTFIETRGLGGQFVVSPTPGYKVIQGDWCDLPKITTEEREVLLQCARALDKEVRFVENGRLPKVRGIEDEIRPGDIYNQKGEDEALTLLKESGWSEVYESRGTKYLRRPGKDVGISATFGHIAPGIFYCFTSNGAPFEGGKAYSPFAVFTIIRHGGDYSQSARELAKEYGMSGITTKISAKLASSAYPGIKLEEEKKNVESGHLTDTANAEKIVELYGDKMRYDHRRGRWLLWRGHRWQPDVDGSISRIAIEAAKVRFKEAVNIEDMEMRGRVSKWAIQSESKMRIDASIGLAKNLLPIADSGDNWDTDNMVLSCPNGVVDLRSGLIRDGKPEDRITMSTGASYDPGATCPLWEKFISEVFMEDAELIHWVQKCLGYSLTGSTREQVVFFCFGTGANGKSVLFSTIRELLKDYAHSAPPTMFQKKIMPASSNDAAAIEFKRFIMSSEVLSTGVVDELRLKKWSGGDQETARYLYKEFFSFNPVCKIWLFVNHKPRVEDDSHGFWRRVRLIPFDRTFKVEEQDRELTNKLRSELSGILNWLLDGCLMWLEEGLDKVPEKVEKATDSYQIENDPLVEFIGDCCEVGLGFSVKSSEIYAVYRNWADIRRLSGRDVFSQTKFGIVMGDRYTRLVMKTGSFYQGVRVSANISPEYLTKPYSTAVVGFEALRRESGGFDPLFTKLPNTSSHIESFIEKGINPPPSRNTALKPTTNPPKSQESMSDDDRESLLDIFDGKVPEDI